MKPHNDNALYGNAAPPSDSRRSATASGPPQPMPAAAAVHAFLAEMIEFGGGGELQWKRVAHSYNALRAQRGWPHLPDQVLSSLLVALGCTRERRRLKGIGRVVVIGFPLEVDHTLPDAAARAS